MGWTSTNIKVEMMNEQAAINAAEAIKNYAFANAERFSSMNADTLADDLTVEGNRIILDDSYFIHGWDFLELIPELCKVMAELDSSASFSGCAGYSSGYGDDGEADFTFVNHTLTCKTLFFEDGNCFWCPDDEECGAIVCIYEDLIANETFICPECGKEYTADELIGTRPQITEVAIEIA